MIKLSDITKKQPTKYQTYLADFLGRIATNKKRRAIVVFSDFLALDTKQVKQFQQAKKEHVLVLFQLPVNKEMGQNYDLSMIKNHPIPGIELLKI